MANRVNLTRLLELAGRDELVRKAGLIPVVIPADTLRDLVLNPNYVPKDLPTHSLIITWLCIFIPLVCVILRFLARFGTESRLGLDDWFSALAWIAAAVFGSTSILAVHMGSLGKHIWLATDAELNFGYTIGYFHQIAYGIAAFFLHNTIMFFYIRIIPPDYVARKLLYAFFAFHIIFLPVYVGVSAVQCSPFRSSYDLRYRLMIGEQNKCVDPIKLVTALTIIGITADCLLFFLPLSVVWRLRLEVRQKVLVSVLFLLGGLACVASGIRLHYLRIFYASFDRTYSAMPINALGHIEIALGLLTACLPMMRQAVLLLPRGSFYSLVFSRLRLRRRRRNSIRAQKIDSRSTRLTTTDIVESNATALHELRGPTLVPPVPPPLTTPAPAAAGFEGGGGGGGGGAYTQSPRWEAFSGRSRPSTRGTGGGNMRNSRHERVVSYIRDIAREAYRTQDSGESIEIDDLWIMTEDGPVRVPMRYESPGRARLIGRES